MMIARWHVDARFGHKQTLIDSLKKWRADIGSQIGWTADKTRIVTGSIGALESTVELEVEIDDLTELNAAWTKLENIEAHKKWGKDIETYLVSGSPHWQVFRVI